MRHSILLLSLVGLMAGCASHSVRDRLEIQDSTVLASGLNANQSVEAGAPTKDWFAKYQGTDAKTMLPSLEQRLNALGALRSSYDGAKAQCWTQAAQEEYDLHDQWGFVPEAMGEADRLLHGLETGQPLTDASPPLRTASKVRPDLWEKIGTARTQVAERKDCDEVIRILACSEVQLAHAGHDAWRRSFERAQARVVAVESDINTVDAKINSCPVRLSAPPESGPLPETRTLRGDAVFRFDRGDEAGLLPQGNAELVALANSLVQTADVQWVEVLGFADRLGPASLNQRLSAQRAETVKHFLRGHGGERLRIDAKGEGATQPVVFCDGVHGRALIDCLAPNRRVEIRIYRNPP